MQTMLKTFSGMVLGLAGMLLGTGGAWANTLYVSPEGGDIYPYSDWKTAATDIQTAVDAAKDGDEVVLAPGVYEPREEIIVKSSIMIRRGDAFAPSVVSGSLRHRVFKLDGANARPVLQDLDIIYGATPDEGGGVLASGGEIRHCTIIGCVAGSGGGIYLEGAARMRDSWVYGNRARTGGGAYLAGESHLDRTWVSLNSAEREGAGVFLAGGALRDSCVAPNVTVDGRIADLGVSAWEAKGSARSGCATTVDFQDGYAQNASLLLRAPALDPIRIFLRDPAFRGDDGDENLPDFIAERDREESGEAIDWEGLIEVLGDFMMKIDQYLAHLNLWNGKGGGAGYGGFSMGGGIFDPWPEGSAMSELWERIFPDVDLFRPIPGPEPFDDVHYLDGPAPAPSVGSNVVSPQVPILFQLDEKTITSANRDKAMALANRIVGDLNNQYLKSPTFRAMSGVIDSHGQMTIIIGDYPRDPNNLFPLMILWEKRLIMLNMSQYEWFNTFVPDHQEPFNVTHEDAHQFDYDNHTMSSDVVTREVYAIRLTNKIMLETLGFACRLRDTYYSEGFPEQYKDKKLEAAINAELKKSMLPLP